MVYMGSKGNIFEFYVIFDNIFFVFYLVYYFCVNLKWVLNNIL